jgi:hypothetical protein
LARRKIPSRALVIQAVANLFTDWIIPTDI